MTKPDLLRRWLIGPPGWSMTVCENDLELGSIFRWEWRSPGGEAMVMRGVNHEVVRPERIVRTESFEFGRDGKVGEQLATLALDGPRSGSRRTDLRFRLLYITHQRRLVTRPSPRAWNMAWPWATTGSSGYWRRQRPREAPLTQLEGQVGVKKP